MNKHIDNEILWKQYELHARMYQQYLELVLKFNAFFYAITGGIISFYLSRPKTELPTLRFALLVPIVMSVCFGIVMAYAAKKSWVTRQDMFDLRDAMGLSVAPDSIVLTLVLVVTSVLLFVVAAGLGILFYRGALV